LYQGSVQPEWIDYNGHMNVAYYVLAFDHATDVLLDHIGMDGNYRSEQHGSIFTLELHVNYLQELKLSDPIRCDTQLLDYDSKRIHYFHYLYHAQENYLAATSEMIVMHMDMRARRGAAMPEFIQHRLQTLLTEHNLLPRPPQAGSVIGIRRK
jgi:acyl-CoA thioester hydrolase